jgi:hypothetical protein
MMSTARTARRAAIAAGLVMLIPATVALAASSGTFTGTTSQGKSCAPHFRSSCKVRVVVANGSVQKQGTGHSHIFWAAACSSGKNEVLANETSFWGKLNAGHLRLKNEKYTQKKIPGSGGPYSARNTVNMTLHASNRVTGTFSASAVVYKGTKVVNRCHTGTVHFTASK